MVQVLQFIKKVQYYDNTARSYMKRKTSNFQKAPTGTGDEI